MLCKNVCLFSKRFLRVSLVSLLILMLIVFPYVVNAQHTELLGLPAIGSRVNITNRFTPLLLKGLQIDINEFLNLGFIIDTGNEDKLSKKWVRMESEKLVKYFLTALTVPEEDLWVNLSPYEGDKIVAEGFGKTEMSRDLLAQDYLLKQLTASLMFPEGEVGRQFWNRVKEEFLEKHGVEDMSVQSFSKVWIVPDESVVFEDKNRVYVTKSTLKVMMEKDYLATEKHGGNENADIVVDSKKAVIRNSIISAIEKEVNHGSHFAKLRQIYHALILAKWYKQKVRNVVLDNMYLNKNKTKGVDLDDKNVNKKIYERYVRSYEEGVFSYIREEYDETYQEIVPRKYFSGGANMQISLQVESKDSGMLTKVVLPFVGKGLLILVTFVAILGSVPKTVVAKEIKDTTLLQKKTYKTPKQVKEFLHMVGKGNIKFVEEYLNKGGDPNVLGKKGRVALYIAWKKNLPEMALKLLTGGASPYTKMGPKYDNNTVMQKVTRSDRRKKTSSVIRNFTIMKKFKRLFDKPLQEMKTFLRRLSLEEMDLTDPVTGGTFFHVALSDQRGGLKVIKLINSVGVVFDFKTFKKGNTLYDLAKTLGNTEVIKFLENVPERNKKLQELATQGRIKEFEDLLYEGANIFWVNKKGQSVLEVVLENEQKEILEILVKYYVDLNSYKLEDIEEIRVVRGQIYNLVYVYLHLLSVVNISVGDNFHVKDIKFSSLSNVNILVVHGNKEITFALSLIKLNVVMNVRSSGHHAGELEVREGYYRTLSRDGKNTQINWTKELSNRYGILDMINYFLGNYIRLSIGEVSLEYTPNKKSSKNSLKSRKGGISLREVDVQTEKLGIKIKGNISKIQEILSSDLQGFSPASLRVVPIDSSFLYL